MKILVTGGAGFIGSNLVRYLLKLGHDVCNVDKLTYAGSLESLLEIQDFAGYQFHRVDISEPQQIASVINAYQPDAVMHLAAETHVDRSIDASDAFIQTNILGTFHLLEAVRRYWLQLLDDKKAGFRFLHVSTDEVYGDLQKNSLRFSESTPYAPSSPYSASKASSDHLVRAWCRTYGLPTLITNCSNNYGPYQFPEKLIPLMILNALEGKPLPVYGDGKQIRDWLYVGDHAEALFCVLTKGRVGETYNIGGDNEQENIFIVQEICHLLESLAPSNTQGVKKYTDLIGFVKDRPGHDRRYAIDATKIRKELDWKPKETVATGLKKTVQWYLDNLAWCVRVQGDGHKRQRLGLNQ